jgi:arabinose-5-phosphate isomerase
MKETEETEGFQEIPISTRRLIEGRSILDQFVVVMDGIDIDDGFSEVVNELLGCKGKIVTTGIGKAGHAMKKFSSLLCSLGFPSCFMHPGEASHGDLGIMGSSDILFVASTSGKTREVLEVIDLARNININKIIGITSHEDSPIRGKADIILDMGNIIEAGHLRMAPTSSILVMLALTDTVALVAAREKGLTKEEYGKYHHGGYLGKKARGEI